MCHVRHFTLFCPELPLAVMELNGDKHCDMPTFAYTGTSWQEGAKEIVKNAGDAIVTHLNAMHEANCYPLKGAPVPGAGSSGTGARLRAKPILDHGTLKHTCPRANGDLPLRESVLQDMLSRYKGFPEMAKDSTSTLGERRCRGVRFIPQHR